MQLESSDPPAIEVIVAPAGAPKLAKVVESVQVLLSLVLLPELTDDSEPRGFPTDEDQVRVDLLPAAAVKLCALDRNAN